MHISKTEVIYLTSQYLIGLVFFFCLGKGSYVSWQFILIFCLNAVVNGVYIVLFQKITDSPYSQNHQKLMDFLNLPNGNLFAKWIISLFGYGVSFLFFSSLFSVKDIERGYLSYLLIYSLTFAVCYILNRITNINPKQPYS